MTENNYYSQLGEYLRKNLSSEEDPFADLNKGRTKYRRIGNRIERRPPPESVSVYTDDEKDNEWREKLVAVPDALVEDFAVLQLRPGSPLAWCKDSWRRLLKKFHPDTITTAKNITAEEAADVVRRLNNAYRRIEHWYKTGKVLDVKKDL